MTGVEIAAENGESVELLSPWVKLPESGDYLNMAHVVCVARINSSAIALYWHMRGDDYSMYSGVDRDEIVAHLDLMCDA